MPGDQLVADGLSVLDHLKADKGIKDSQIGVVPVGDVVPYLGRPAAHGIGANLSQGPIADSHCIHGGDLRRHSCGLPDRVGPPALFVFRRRAPTRVPQWFRTTDKPALRP
jgi:hypothetical protein